MSQAAGGTGWRHGNMGRLLNNAVRRFEGRVLELMAEAGHGETRMAHIGLTRNLDVEGTRLTELARRAMMTKQAMGELVDGCERLGLVRRLPDPADRRARIVAFTEAGLAWLESFRLAVATAEREMEDELGGDTVATLRRALAAYGAGFAPLRQADPAG